MSRSARVMPLVLLALSSLGGCRSAAVRLACEDAGGGVVVLPNNTNVWPTYYRSRAEKLMAAKCPGGYAITREVEVEQGRPDLAPNDNPRWEYDGALRRMPADREYQITFHGTAP